MAHHGEFSVVAGEGGGVMAGVPGGALGLAPSAIGFGGDAQAGAEVASSKSGGSLCRSIGQEAGRAGGREGGREG
jgi:hypothetical protein